MTYRHRPATRDDLAAIVEIYNHAVADRSSTCDLEPVSLESRRAWFDESRLPIWVGHEPDSPRTVTGYLSFEPFLNGRPGYDVTADLAVYLHPDHRGRGQGRHLLTAAVEHAPTLGFRTLATTIFASNEASLRLFASHEFERWGLLPGVADLGGVVQDIVVVGRRV